MEIDIFDPTSNTVAITIGTSSANAALAQTSPRERQVRVHNAGSNLIFVAFGNNAVAAVAPTSGNPANGMPVPAGAVEVFTLRGSETHAAVISAAAGGTAYFTIGAGL